MTALYFIPPRGAFVNPDTGELTRVAEAFLRGLYIRVGGANGDSTTDVSLSNLEDAGNSETQAALFRSIQDAGQSPYQVIQDGSSAQDAGQSPSPVIIISADIWLDHAAQVASLQDQIAELAKDIQGLRQNTII